MTHKEMIQQAHDALFKVLPKSLTDKDKAIIEDAYVVAADAHRTQMRETGEPYLLHPLAVALIVVEEMLQSEAAMIAAALLHDVVEDNEDYTIDYIRNRFGDRVAFLVGAVTKPNKDQVESLKHILTSMRGDVHVLILKLADRTHNLRTLGDLKPEKRWRVASESQLVYAPLAGRLGMYEIKSELENLSFKYLNPLEYESIESLVDEERARIGRAVDTFLFECLHYVGGELGGQVGWGIRWRKPYAIYRDMMVLGCDFDQVPFKHYIRVNYDYWDMEYALSHGDSVILSDEDIIFRIYSTLVNKYGELTGSLVNYLASPKANGYKALHFRLLNPYGGIEEFHVASDEMRNQAKYGCILDPDAGWVQNVLDELEELAKDKETSQCIQPMS